MLLILLPVCAVRRYVNGSFCFIRVFRFCFTKGLIETLIVKDHSSLGRNRHEDNALGKLSNERYAAMSVSLETKQNELKETVPSIESEINTETDKIDNIQITAEEWEYQFQNKYLQTKEKTA